MRKLACNEPNTCTSIFGHRFVCVPNVASILCYNGGLVSSLLVIRYYS